MPSSISNSKAGLPNVRWGRTWRVALLLLPATLGGWEALWRSKGFEPLIRDTVETWTAARSRVKSDSVVLIGTSRIQSAVDPKYFSSGMGGRTPIHLAIPTASPLPMLEDLAQDHSFSGLVIVDLIPYLVFEATLKHESEILKYIQAYHEYLKSPAKRLEIQLRLEVQSRFVFPSPTLSPQRIFSAAWNGEPLHKPFFRMQITRYIPNDFSGTNNKEKEEGIYNDVLTDGPPATHAKLEAILERIENAVSRIQERGGTVVFVRFPFGGKVRQIEEQRYPRRDYWDVLAVRTKAATIHSDDYPSLANFHCPEGSHLNYLDVPRFTIALALILKEKENAQKQSASAPPRT